MVIDVFFLNKASKVRQRLAWTAFFLSSFALYVLAKGIHLSIKWWRVDVGLHDAYVAGAYVAHAILLITQIVLVVVNARRMSQLDDEEPDEVVENGYVINHETGDVTKSHQLKRDKFAKIAENAGTQSVEFWDKWLKDQDVKSNDNMRKFCLAERKKAVRREKKNKKNTITIDTQKESPVVEF